MATVPILALPAELAILVFERLDSFRDICECSKVCRQWRAVANGDSIWGGLLRRRCVDVSAEWAEAGAELAGERTMCRNKAIFARWYRRYRGFTDSYTRMRRAFRRLETWADMHSPLLRQSLAPGLG
ncbi:hypothetical protein H4R19_004170, partial [Coemansia spiralis]